MINKIDKDQVDTPQEFDNCIILKRKNALGNKTMFIQKYHVKYSSYFSNKESYEKRRYCQRIDIVQCLISCIYTCNQTSGSTSFGLIHDFRA